MQAKLSDLIQQHPERKYFLCSEVKEGAENLSPFMQSVKRCDYFIENGKPFVEYQPTGVIDPVASNPPHTNDIELAVALRKQLSADEERYNHYRVLVTTASPYVKAFAEQLQKAFDEQNIPFDIALHVHHLVFTGNRADNQDLRVGIHTTNCATREACNETYNRLFNRADHQANLAASPAESMRLTDMFGPMLEVACAVTKNFDPANVTGLDALAKKHAERKAPTELHAERKVHTPREEKQAMKQELNGIGNQGNFFADEDIDDAELEVTFKPEMYETTSLEKLILAAEKSDSAVPAEKNVLNKNKEVR